MATQINYNERSWAIDVISEIKRLTTKRNYLIKNASGENTLKTKEKIYFPDVLLFSDESAARVLQGWELKLPDTPISDIEFNENAEKKARKLNLKSFLLWNAKEAVLFVLSPEDDRFHPLEKWNTGINSRNEVKENAEAWKKTLADIIEKLDDYFKTGKIETTLVQDAINEQLFNTLISDWEATQISFIKEECRRDALLEAEIKNWFKLNEKDFGKLYKKAERAIANVNIIGWINRFLFAHYLKFYNNKAELIDELGPESTLEDGLQVFEEITSHCDFMNVFRGSIGYKLMSKEFWSELMQFNGLLKEMRLKGMKLQDYSEILKKIIDSALGFTSQKLAGQFITPEPLAKYLASITIINREGDVIDPCCGTGTIAKAAYNLKCDKGMPVDLALGTTWASDKFSSPLQLCSIRLSDPQLMGEVVQVFQEDAFKVLPEQPIDFTDPSTGETTQRQLLKFHGVISNLPFVQFEDFRKYNDFVDEVRENLKTRHQTIPSNKADLYAYLALKLRDIVSQDGRLGFILSNSWLGTMWGKDFRDCLLRDYRIKQIVMSGSGRWFEPKAVTTILVLEPREPGQSPDKDDEEISFITTLLPIEQWDEEELEQLASSTILNEPIERKLSIQKLTLTEIESLESTTGVSWSAFFTNTSWLHKLGNSLVPITQYFDIFRGERRGWNKMFYPADGHGIESKYIKPVVKSPKELGDSLVIQPQAEAFCCSDSINAIKSKGNNGALDWINKFKSGFNNTGVPLKEALKKANHHWYEMKDNTLADLCLAVAPDKKISFFRLETPSFLDQRLTCLREKDSLENLDVAHALLNSAIGIFFVESIGFGRGLGVLDTAPSNVESNLKILDPQNLSEEDIQVLLDAFEPLVNRAPMDLPSELESEDRINFDDTVISLYNLDINRDEVYKSLLELFEKRQTARLKT